MNSMENKSDYSNHMKSQYYLLSTLTQKSQHNNWISLMKSRRKCQQNRENSKAKKQFLAYHHRCLCNR